MVGSLEIGDIYVSSHHASYLPTSLFTSLPSFVCNAAGEAETKYRKMASFLRPVYLVIIVCSARSVTIKSSLDLFRCRFAIASHPYRFLDIHVLVLFVWTEHSKLWPHFRHRPTGERVGH